jgi:hypothetical protein
VCFVVLTVNSQRKSIKSHTKPIKIQIFLLYKYKYKYFCYFIGFVCDFIDFVCKFTVEATEHTVASYDVFLGFWPNFLGKMNILVAYSFGLATGLSICYPNLIRMHNDFFSCLVATVL